MISIFAQFSASITCFVMNSLLITFIRAWFQQNALITEIMFCGIVRRHAIIILTDDSNYKHLQPLQASICNFSTHFWFSTNTGCWNQRLSSPNIKNLDPKQVRWFDTCHWTVSFASCFISCRAPCYEDIARLVSIIEHGFDVLVFIHND